MKGKLATCFIYFVLITMTDAFFRSNFRIYRRIQSSRVSTDPFQDQIEGSLSTGELAPSFLAQKNYILLEKFISQLDNNITDVANHYINYCDESFNLFLNERIANADNDQEQTNLGKIRYEINCARQRKLIEADNILREILSAGELKKMEAKLKGYLKKGEIDMAFLVILQLNIEDAINAKAETAVQVMTHMGTLITEHQDALVKPPVRLLRQLMRADDKTTRKRMLMETLDFRENLEKGLNDGFNDGLIENNSSEIGKSGLSKKVSVMELEETIEDVLSQMIGIGGEEQTITDLNLKCALLREEISEVSTEFENTVSE